MHWQEFTALLVLTTAMSFSPGPNTTLSAALAANVGLRRAMRFVVAVPIGWSLLLALCAAGLGTLVLAMPALRSAIKGLGIVYLLWLAWKLSRSATLGEATSARLTVGFGQGVALQFVNIKGWLMALTVAAGWIAGQSDPLHRFAIITCLMLVMMSGSTFLYAMMGSLLRRWLALGRRLLWFNRAMAALLVFTAAWMVRL